MTEFEIKCVLDTSEAEERVLRFLRNKGAERPVVLTLCDRYYDTPQRDLFRLGVFLRVRNDDLVAVKHNPISEDTGHVSCTEREFRLPLSRAAAETVRAVVRSFLPYCAIDERSNEIKGVLSSFSLRPFVTLKKIRCLWRLEGVELCIDDVEDLGRFLEIEARGEAGQAAVAEVAHALSVDNIPVGYVELYLRKHEWSTYLRGRYVLAEDRVKAMKRKEWNGPQDA